MKAGKRGMNGKKITTFLLSLLMVFMMLPVEAFAGVRGNEDTVSEDRIEEETDLIEEDWIGIDDAGEESPEADGDGELPVVWLSSEPGRLSISCVSENIAASNDEAEAGEFYYVTPGGAIGFYLPDDYWPTTFPKRDEQRWVFVGWQAVDNKGKKMKGPYYDNLPADGEFTALWLDLEADPNAFWEYEVRPNGTDCILTGYRFPDTVNWQLTTLNVPNNIMDKSENGGNITYHVTGVDVGNAFVGRKKLTTILFYEDAAIDTMFKVTDCVTLKSIEVIRTGNPVDKNTLPASVKTIPYGALAGTAITSLSMPGVTRVEGCDTGYTGAFEGCNSLTGITFGMQNVTIESMAFSKIGSTLTITYPGKMSDLSWDVVMYSPNVVFDCSDGYLGWCGSGWGTGTGQVSGIFDGNCTHYTLSDEGALVIDSYGGSARDLYEAHETEQVVSAQDGKWSVWNSDDEEWEGIVKTVTVGQVYGIEKETFYHQYNLTTADLGTCIRTLGESAFSECTSLTNIALPSGLTSLGNGVFSGCKSLKSIDLPTGLTSLGNDVFSGCKSIESIDLPSGLTSLGDHAFYGCAFLKSINLPNGVITIGNHTFGYCTALKNLYFDGTKAKWDAVTKGIGWDRYVSSDFTEHWRCTVTFSANGHGTAPDPQTNLWSNESKVTQPDDLTAEGLNFTGWYTDEACTAENKWDFNDPVTGDMALHAGWSAATYAVTVTNGTGGGNYAENASVTIKANAPEAGKRFKDWSGTEDLVFTAGSALTAEATFTMPARALALTANYEDQPAQEKVASPVFDPAAGSYNEAQTVTISCSTQDAKIYYTLDGTTPSSSAGSLYSGAIRVDETITIKAVAVKENMEDSEVVTAAYTITLDNPPEPDPDFALYVKEGTEEVSCSDKEVITGGSFTLIPKFAEGKVTNSRVVWESANPAVASVSQSGKVTGRSIGMTVVTARSEEDPELTASMEVTVTDPVEGIALDKKSYSFGYSEEGGESVELNATLLPHSASQEVKWSTDNAGVLILCDDEGYELSGEMNGKGKVYAVSENQSVKVRAVGTGKASVTAAATDGSNKKAVCKFTVGKAVPAFTIEGKNKKTSVKAGKTLQISVNWGGKKKKPANTGVEWSVLKASDLTDASDIAVISSKGVLTAITQGTVIVTATSKANPEKTASMEITVTAPAKSKAAKVTGIEFKNKETLADKGLAAGKSYKLTKKLTLSGKGKAAADAVAFISTDNSVATVDQKGVIRGVSAGTVTIKAVTRDAEDIASAPGDSVTFTVYSGVKSLKLEQTKLILGTQDGAQYGTVKLASLLPADAQKKDIKWTAGSKNVKLAAIAADGGPSTGEFAEPGASVTVEDGKILAVMGIAPGTVKLTGTTTDGTKKKVTCTVTVRGQVTGLKLKTKAAKKGVNNITLADKEETADTIEYTGIMKANSTLTLTPVPEINGISAGAKKKADQKLYKAYAKVTDTGISYRSSDISVATVDAKGKISVKKGTSGKTVKIHAASADGKYRAEYEITVK